jgi:hypothetical protein
MGRLTAVLTLATFAMLGSVAAAESVAVCGTLRSFTAPTEAANVGSATVSDKTYPLSGTPGPNTLSPQATVGSTVCLTGQIAFVETGPVNLLIRWSLTPNTGSPGASSLPSTATNPAATGVNPLLILAGAAAVAAIAGALMRSGAIRFRR